MQKLPLLATISFLYIAKCVSLCLVAPLIFFLYRFERKIGVISKEEQSESSLKKEKTYSLYLLIIGVFSLSLTSLLLEIAIKEETNSILFYFVLLFFLIIGLISLVSSISHFLYIFTLNKNRKRYGFILLAALVTLITSLLFYFKSSLLPNLASGINFFMLFVFIALMVSISLLGVSLTMIFGGAKKK
jgi:hypothetical protein